MSDFRNTPNRAGEVRLRLVGGHGDETPSLAHAAPSAEPRHEAAEHAELSRRMAHELANLLDGSMRNMAIALSQLGCVDDGVSEIIDESTQRLRTATDAMRRMGLLLRRWMTTRTTDVAHLYWHEATLGEAVQYAVSMLQPIADVQGITLDVLIPADLAAAEAGPLYPVIANGMRNALEAIERGGTVTVRGWLIGDEAKLEIADDGPGVAPFLPRDPDGVISAGATTKAAGHGMGLAVSRDIVQSLGGSLKLADRAGGGAVLSVQWNIRRLPGEEVS